VGSVSSVVNGARRLETKTVGVVGLGIMGSAMAANLLRAGFAVAGYDVLASRRRQLRGRGGIVASSADDLAGRADVIVSSLPSSDALIEVASAVAGAPRRPRVFVETSTLPIAVKEQARERLAAGGTVLLDCPLSGTGAQAKTRDLVVFASGDRAAYRRAVPVFDAVARSHYYLGAFGAGSKMKFVANLLVAVHNVAAAEAIVLGMKAGLDPSVVVRVIGDGAGSSRMFQVRGPMMARGDYAEASMKLGVWQKDMTIIADFARALDCPTPLFAASAPIYTAANALGREDDDTAAVCAVLERMANHHRKRQR
jgi:3-hydroxyisobutyrate dehydrogenase-like beta-hydroxyacid dehydrogenase